MKVAYCHPVESLNGKSGPRSYIIFRDHNRMANARNRGREGNQSSVTQVFTRQALSVCSSGWDDLTNAQRLEWEDAAEYQSTVIDRTDFLIPPKAQFIKCNIIRVLAKQSLLSSPGEPPPIVSPKEILSFDYDAPNQQADMVIRINNSPGHIFKILLKGSPSHPSMIKQWSKSKFRAIKAEDTSYPIYTVSLTSGVGIDNWNCPYYYTIGHYVQIMITILSADYWPGSQFILSSLIS